MIIIPPVASPRFTFQGTTPSFIPATPTRTPFAQITRPFISDPRINLREFRVYTALLTFPPGDNGERWPSRETIGRLTGLPPKVVSRTTSRLQDLGWLVKFGDGGRSRTARYIVFDQAQPPGVILNYHTANRTPDTAQDDLPIHPQTDPVDPVNPPQNEPGLSPKGGQNGEGQEVDYLDAVDKREATPEPARPEPAPQPQAAHSQESLRTIKTPPPDCIPDGWLERAINFRSDLPAEQIKTSIENFLDRNRAKGLRLVDWEAELRVWLRRERAVKPHQNASTAPPAVNRYAHLDLPMKPVSAAVQAVYARSEASRIADLLAAGIDPKTGWRITPPTPCATAAQATPIQPGRSFDPSVETLPTTPAEACADFEAKRRVALEQLAALQAAKAAKAATPPTPPIHDQADQSYEARLAALEARIAGRKAGEGK